MGTSKSQNRDHRSTILASLTASYRRHNTLIALHQAERDASPEHDLWVLQVARRMGVRARNPIARMP